MSVTVREQRLRHRIDALCDERDAYRRDYAQALSRVAHLEEMLNRFDWVKQMEKHELTIRTLRVERNDYRKALRAEQKRSENAQVAVRLNRDRADRLEKQVKRLKARVAV